MLWLWPEVWSYVVVNVIDGSCGLRGFAAIGRFLPGGGCGRLRGRVAIASRQRGAARVGLAVDYWDVV